MKSYQELIEQITSLIISDEKLQEKNTIIIGDNSSGKSDLILNIMEKISTKFYFIDSVNRSILINEIIDDDTANINFETILKSRISKENFNKKDTFGVTKIETIIYKYREKLCELAGIFLSSDVQINTVKTDFSDDYVLKIDGKDINEIDVRLSNGYQAIFRLILEVLFYTDQIKDSDDEKHKVFIDEIDENLSPNHQGKILSFLIKEFPNVNFIVSTHSINLVSKTSSCNIVLLGTANYEVYNSSDFDSLQLAQNIFLKRDKNLLFNNEEEQLRILLNHKISNCWDVKDNENLVKFKNLKLTPANELIYRTIIDW